MNRIICLLVVSLLVFSCNPKISTATGLPQEISDKNLPTEHSATKNIPTRAQPADTQKFPEGRRAAEYGNEEPIQGNGLQLFYYNRIKDSIHEIWIFNKITGNQTFLYEYDRSAQAQTSDDGRSIRIVDRYASDATRIVFFKNAGNDKYIELDTGDIAQKGLVLLSQIFHLTSIPKIDHLYCNSNDFPDDEGNIGVVIWGDEGGKQSLDHWFFSYNINTHVAFKNNREESKDQLPLTPIMKE